MTQILKNRWFEVVLILLLLAVIGIVLTSYALQLIERQFYPRSVNSLQTINTAEYQYKLSYPQRGYSRTLAELAGTQCGPPSEASACLIDQAIANATSPATPKSGYVYTYVAGQPDKDGIIRTYSARSDPVTANSGTNHFYIDETGVLRVEKDKPASKASPIAKSE